MLIAISYLLFFLFLFLSGIHFYWIFGGKWGAESVFPTKPGDETINFPGKIPTLIVALFLLGIGLFYLIKIGTITYSLPENLRLYGLKILAALFIIRTIGDFNYIGFFKKHKQTKFGQNDSKYYSPLCLVIGILTLLLDYKIAVN